MQVYTMSYEYARYDAMHQHLEEESVTINRHYEL
jgi:hypothetical protein